MARALSDGHAVAASISIQAVDRAYNSGYALSPEGLRLTR
jgi:hypothetical protein